LEPGGFSVFHGHWPRAGCMFNHKRNWCDKVDKSVPLLPNTYTLFLSLPLFLKAHIPLTLNYVSRKTHLMKSVFSKNNFKEVLWLKRVNSKVFWSTFRELLCVQSLELKKGTKLTKEK
jgi:hypothetical protein